MINWKQHTAGTPSAAALNITPLIDMVFILLIFFAVNASFVKEAGVEVERPTARSAVVQPAANIMIAVTRSGEVWIDRQRVDPRSVRGHVERLRAENPEGSVVILADQDSLTGLVIQVLDQARLAGVENVAVAATGRGE
jgi:biopolymer transport protein ExbD